jgi:hypothetical protein
VQNQDAELAGLARRFEERLVLSLKEARSFDPFLPKELLESIKKNGVLTTVKDEIRKQTRILPEIPKSERLGRWVTVEAVDQAFQDAKLQDAGAYFLMLKENGRLDLSVEALVTLATFAPLFTDEDRQISAARLEKHGWTGQTSSSERVSLTAASAVKRARQELPSFFVMSAEPVRECGEFDCDLRLGVFTKGLREHLRSCAACPDAHPRIIEALSRFDSAMFDTIEKLLDNWGATFDFSEERIERIADLPEPWDFEDERDEESYKYQRQEMCDEWSFRLWKRAAILGFHIGCYMEHYECTHDGYRNPTLWVRWRGEASEEKAAQFVRSLDEDAFEMLLAARKLFDAVSIPSRPPESHYEPYDPLLWLPADGDSERIDGVLHPEEVYGEESWDALLELWPEDAEPGVLLRLCYQAAAFENRSSIPQTASEGPAPGELGRRVDEILALLQELRSDQRAFGDPAIALLEQIVAHLKAADRFSCEERLTQALGATYAKLKPEVRRLLIAGEQILQTRDFAAPDMVVQAISTAFEVQFKASILQPLFEKLRGSPHLELVPLPGWKGCDPRRPVWSRRSRVDRYNLGDALRLIRHPEVAPFLDSMGVDKYLLAEAIELVLPARNKAAHGEAVFYEQAAHIRQHWFGWQNLEGGILAALLPRKHRR